MVETAGPTLVELRVLDGANLYFPRPTIKLTLEVPGLLSLPEERAVAVASEVGLLAGSPGPPGGEQRRRFATRLLAHLVRRTAAGRGRAGRARPPGPEPTQLVVRLPVAAPARRRGPRRAVAELAPPRTPAWPGGRESGGRLREVEAGRARRCPCPGCRRWR